jgi:hypothetical protein
MPTAQLQLILEPALTFAGGRAMAEISPDPTPSRPLWKVMRDAYDDAFPEYDEITDGYAAELRAIAERIQDEYASGISVVGVVSMLRAEADRAEAGE